MESFTKAMQDAQAELSRLDDRRRKLLKVIEDLKELSGDDLLELTPPPGYEPEGMTAEVRKILTLSPVHLSAVQIRDTLLTRGFGDKEPKTLLIAVHTVLTRIEKELDVDQHGEKPAYKIYQTFGGTLAALATQMAMNSYATINPKTLAELAKATHPWTVEGVAKIAPAGNLGELALAGMKLPDNFVKTKKK